MSITADKWVIQRSISLSNGRWENKSLRRDGNRPEILL